MEINTPKKEEKIKIDKSFLTLIAKKVDDVERRVTNIENFNSLDAQLKSIQPAVNSMSKIISAPDLDMECEFMDDAYLTYESIKANGFLFQQDLEQIIKKHGIKSINLKYKRITR